MTAIDDAISAIQQSQNDLANIVTLLQAYLAGTSNGITVDKVSLKTKIQALGTNVSTNLNNAKTLLQTAITGL